ncbi:MAG: hypothetical protein QX191_08780 [Methylococcaceae bacterium]
MKSYKALIGIYSSVLLLAGCVATTPAPAPFGYGMAPLIVEPVFPSWGVKMIAPTGVVPGPNWGWAYHPKLGWGWHHPHEGWRHR